MCEFNKFNNSRFIDPCMKNFIETLNIMLKESSLKIVACCCGHKKYPMTIVIKNTLSGKHYDLVSSRSIPREKKFYKKDERGVYFIPEVLA